MDEKQAHEKAARYHATAARYHEEAAKAREEAAKAHRNGWYDNAWMFSDWATASAEQADKASKRVAAWNKKADRADERADDANE